MLLPKNRLTAVAPRKAAPSKSALEPPSGREAGGGGVAIATLIALTKTAAKVSKDIDVFFLMRLSFRIWTNDPNGGKPDSESG